MKVKTLHPWPVTVKEAMQLQKELSHKVSRDGGVSEVSLVAGVDISAPDARGVAKGAVVVLRYPELEVEEIHLAEGRPAFPYVPGLLSFRESPLILEAFEGLSCKPDLLLVDGHGIAHPRRMGIASHLGLLLDLPSIGCAKSRLVGQHPMPGAEVGSYTQLLDGDEVIGAVLRTGAGTSPIYVSIGHKIDLETAIRWVMRCCRGYRQPEPTRLAHQAAAGRPLPHRRSVQGSSGPGPSGQMRLL